MLSRSAHDLFAKSMLTSICLRRSKTSICLPPRTDELHKVDFDEEEAVHYHGANNSIMEFLAHSSITPVAGMATNMLAKINVLRQICNLGLHYKTPQSLSQSATRQASLQENFDGLVAGGVAICSCCGKDLTQGDECSVSALSDAEAFEVSTLWMSKCGETIVCGVCSQKRPQSTEGGCKHQPICELFAIDPNLPSKAIDNPRSIRLPAKLRALQKDLLNLPKNDERLDGYSWLSTVSELITLTASSSPSGQQPLTLSALP